MGELVEDVEHADLPPLMGTILDEVVELAPAKAGDHTWSRCSGRRRMQDPSLSQSLLRFGCLDGTFSPSRSQIRSTRLSFTTQPACLSSAATLR